MYMSKPRRKEFMIGEVKPKARALRHLKVETEKFDNSGLSISQWAFDISIICIRLEEVNI